MQTRSRARAAANSALGSGTSGGLAGPASATADSVTSVADLGETRSDSASQSLLADTETGGGTSASPADAKPDPDFEREGIFAFLKLPAEIRNRIYEVALICDHVTDLRNILVTAPRRNWSHMGSSHVMRSRRYSLTDEYTAKNLQRIIQQPAITRLCREIRQDTLAMFYSQNTFLVDMCGENSYPVEATTKWLKGIGSQNRRLLKDLYLDGKDVFLGEVIEAFAMDKISLLSVKPEGKLAELVETWVDFDLEDSLDDQEVEKRCFKLSFESP